MADKAQEVGQQAGATGARIAHGIGNAAQDAGQQAGPAGARVTEGIGSAAQSLESAAEALTLQVVETKLEGEHTLVGHVLGMRLLLPREGVHGPRETPVLLYLFADSLAIRPSDDAPMSRVPLVSGAPLIGLDLVMPQVAVVHWLYKTGHWAYESGRIAHANIDLANVEEHFEESLAQWTVDDFVEADPKLEVHRTSALTSPLHVYQRLGFVQLWLPQASGRPVRLKSALPETYSSFVKLWKLFERVTWPGGLSMEVPPRDHDPESGS